MAYFSRSNILNINMRADMPGSEAHREYRQRKDLCTHTGEVVCKCAKTALDFLGSEWGAPPTCFLNLKKALYKPKVFNMLEAGLPQAAQAVASVAAGVHLSANLSYLLYLIKMGEGFLKAADQVLTSSTKSRISNSMRKAREWRKRMNLKSYEKECVARGENPLHTPPDTNSMTAARIRTWF